VFQPYAISRTTLALGEVAEYLKKTIPRLHAMLEIIQSN
jgi:hypothetical protein